ncbi:MAG: hypothetical protein WC933_00525 [Candidatus Paceibacterota bacterium]|jgi:hypothetical protein
MEYKIIFGLISTVIGIISFFPYLKNIFARKTKPHIYTWLIWSIIQGVGVVAMIIGGAGAGSWALIIGTIFVFFIFLLSFKYGTKNITKFDTICLIAAIITIIIWIIQKDPLISVILVCLIDFAGFILTYKKIYKEPESETASLYFMYALSNTFALLAMNQYTIITSLYATFLLCANSFCVLLLIVRRKQLKI